MNRLLQWIRAKVSKLFYHFGIHCATHQIRLILISGLVITSLFYPALAIYSTSISKPLAQLSPQLFDRILAPDSHSFSYFDNDLEDIWSRHDALRFVEDSVVRARCGMDGTIRVERLLITTTGLDDSGVINQLTLLSALDAEERLTEYLSSKDSHCLSFPSGRCISISPLEFWAHDKSLVTSDTGILRTVNAKQNLSVNGLPVSGPMVFAGRESAEHSSSSIDFALYLAITYLFHEDDCNGSSGHNAWLRALDDVLTQLGDIRIKVQEPTILAMQFEPEQRSVQHASLITLMLYLSYIIFFIYFSGSMRRMDTVHSRIGLCFTGLVEILVSTVTSLSVCAIGGLKITLVPWGILPIVIVFVGAENMFRLIDEVVKTPISLAVKERIGIGLGRAGTSNTLKVVTYNSIIGIIGFFATGAIRQFCVFAIVVLVAHWFLIHTFFVAVLSIDIQRLELDDLIRQDVNTASPSDTPNGKQSGKEVNGLNTPKFVTSIRKITKGRVTKNVSLLLLLALTGALYYSTRPPVLVTEETQVPLSRASVLHSKTKAGSSDDHATARDIWRTLNPNNNPLLHLRSEAPAIMTFSPQSKDTKTDPRPYRSQVRSLRPLWWIFQIIVVPIGATIGILYALLLYLLKDADLLEAQKIHKEHEEKPAKSPPVEGKALFKTLPRVLTTDVSLLSTNQDGLIAAAVGSGGQAFVWLGKPRKYLPINAKEILMPNSHSGSSLCAISVDDAGTFCAIGSTSGQIGVWKIQPDYIILSACLSIQGFTQSITNLEFLSHDLIDPQENSRHATIPPTLVSFQNGPVALWTTAQMPPIILSSKESLSTFSSCIVSRSPSRPPLVISSDGQNLEIREACLDSISTVVRLPFVGNADDPVIVMHACEVEIEGNTHLVVVTTAHSGRISLWDATNREFISSLDETFGVVNQLRLLSVPSRACQQCGEVPLCSLVLVYSLGHEVFVDRGDLTRRCSCPVNQPVVSKILPLWESPAGRRSRSGSFVSSSGVETSLRSRNRQSSFSKDGLISESSTTLFPVSGHGVHSRRNSDKDQSRRSSDKFEKASCEDCSLMGGDCRSLSVPDPSSLLHSSSSGIRLWGNFKLVRIQATTSERGGWDIVRNQIIGLRRRSRLRQSAPDAQEKLREKINDKRTLSASVLGRWEVWLISPIKGDFSLQTSSLSDIYSNENEDQEGLSQDLVLRRTSTPLSFTRLSPLIAKGPRILGGFGNTVGIITLIEDC